MRNEEEQLEAAGEDCLDGEEITGDDARRLRLQELAPARAAATRRRLETGGASRRSTNSRTPEAAAIGSGWFRRAHRLLDELPRTPEQGWLWIWEGQIALIVGNDPATARRLGADAAELGRSLGLIDMEMTGLGLEGLALVAEGDVAAGMARLDEATTAAVGGR